MPETRPHPLRPLARAAGWLLLLTALAVPVLWAAGGLDWWFAGFTCADGGGVITARECRSGEKASVTALLAAGTGFAGLVTLMVTSRGESAAVLTLDLSALRRQPS